MESSSSGPGTPPPSLEPTSTSPLALDALRTHRIIPVLIDSLTIPLPHGPDADGEVDIDYAEKATRALITFLEACSCFFPTLPPILILHSFYFRVFLQIGGQLSSEEKSQLCKAEEDSGSPTRDAQDPNNAEWEALKRYISVK